MRLSIEFHSSFAGHQHRMEYYMISTPGCCQDYTSVEAVEREVLGSKWWIVGLMDRDFILLSAFPSQIFWPTATARV